MYFFFRESAVEYINCGKVNIKEIARSTTSRSIHVRNVIYHFERDNIMKRSMHVCLLAKIPMPKWRKGRKYLLFASFAFVTSLPPTLS